MALSRVALLLLCVIVAHAAPADQEIKVLPGWSKPLPSKMYAGYIGAGNDTQNGKKYVMHEHYMFIESENDPVNDPVLLWTNGGPGASSFFGLFVELGPFMLSDASVATSDFNSSGVPSLFYNEFGWSHNCNLMILNSPPPVGYSYCDPAGPTGHGSSCGNWDDQRTAEHNYDFMLNFFEAFPEFKKNDLYLSGESYAGIYIPTLARKIYKGKKLNLKGFAVGDGVLGHTNKAFGPGLSDFGTGSAWFHVEFFHGHGQFSDLLYEQIVDVCTIHDLKYNHSISNKKCQALLDKTDTEIGGYYGYNLYDDCWYQNDLVHSSNAYKSLASRQNTEKSKWLNNGNFDVKTGPPALTGTSPADTVAKGLAPRSPNYYQGLMKANAGTSPGQDGYRGGLNDYPCGGSDALKIWINTTEVRNALHVAPDALFFSGDNGVGFNYTGTEPSLFAFYREVQKSDIRVLIYNGDTDPGLNSFLGQNWTSKMGFPVKQPWRPWTLDGRQHMGGYVTRYENDFDFLTIRGSGHMVPEFKPRATAAFLKAWIANKDWLPYAKPPPPPLQR